MPQLRPSIAGHLLRSGFPVSKSYGPGAARLISHTTPRAEADKSQAAETSMASYLNKEDRSVRHDHLDYGAAVDGATSTFTPVPRRVMNGSEEGDVVPAAVLSGAPIELQARTVRIYRAAKPATQSGTWKGHHWRMDWDILNKGHRWENPLIGWQSSGDVMQGTNINFKSKDDAIRFAEKQGYEYFVQEPTERKFIPKAYANNFLWSDKKLKIVRTK
ncbi:hypothetical protein B7463_g9478, partial [Scytalidium lignicola]